MKMDTIQNNVLFGTAALNFKTDTAVVSGFILEDTIYSISLKDLQKALGYDGKSENWLLEILQHISRFSPIDHKLLDALENPFIAIYQNHSGTSFMLKTINVAFIDAILQNIIGAKNDGYLNVSQLRFAKAAGGLLKFLQSNDLYARINESTGFNFFKNKARNKLQQLLADKCEDAAILWVKTLPDPFFEVLFELFDYNWIKLHENREGFAQLFNDVVFSRLPKDLLTILRSNKPKRSYRTKLEQDLQHPHFKAFTNELLVLIEKSAGNKNLFLQLLNRMHPKNSAWLLKDSHFSADSQTKELLLSDFNTTLKQSVFANKNLVTKKKA